jgi:alpha-acetolactate decarboxylase
MLSVFFTFCDEDTKLIFIDGENYNIKSENRYREIF